MLFYYLVRYMFKWIVIAVAFFLAIVSLVYNKAYEDTMADYEPYDFAEFQTQSILSLDFLE